MLDYRLQTFLTLCETMHYTRAAERLCITQPAVTQHIHFLEQHYGCRLFVYQGKTLRLTEEGERLKRMAASLAYNSRKMDEAMNEPAPVRLCVGATKSIGEYVIAPLISQFVRQHPTTALSLAVDNTQVLLRALDQGELDFALVEGFFDKDKYGHRLLRQEQFFGVCAPDHPFAGREVTFEELFSQTILVREQGSGTRAILEDVLHERNHTLDSFVRVLEISDFTVLKSLATQGIGVTFVYAPVAQTELDAGSLASFTLQGLDIRREFNFVYLHDDLFLDIWQDCLNAL